MANHARGEKQAVFGEVRGTSSAGGSDRLVPVGPERWEGFTHRQMWDMIMRSKPDDLFGRVETWRRAASRLEAANKLLQQRLAALLATWQGPAAQAAASSQQRLLGWAQDASVRASTVGAQLANYGNALVSARLRMPQPQHRWAELSFRDQEGANVLEGVAGAHALLQMLSDRLPTEQQVRQARREAVQIMRELQQNAVAAEQAMPQFASAPPATNGPAQPVQQPPVTGPPPAVPSKPPQDPSGRPSGPNGGPSLGGPLPVGPVTPNDTTIAQTVGEPVAHGTGESRGSLPYGGGGQAGLAGRDPMTGGGPFGGGPGSGGGRGAGGGSGTLGRGAGMGAGPFGGVGQGAPAARGAGAGTGGGFVPGAGGGRAGGDEDTEKPLADYLEADDIFSDDRPAFPPVFGA